MAVLGMTGSRSGPSGPQHAWVSSFLDLFLETYGPSEFHHGDCIGSDLQSAVLAKSAGFWVVSHPPTRNTYRAYHDSDVVLDTDEYHVRNRNIADVSTHFLGLPPNNVWVPKSGSWYTLRYAVEKTRAEVVAVGPSGLVLDVAEAVL